MRNKKTIAGPAKQITEKHSQGFQKYFLWGIFALTFIIYSAGLKHDLLNFDDTDYFSKYPEVTDLSWESIGKYFTSYYVIMYQPLPVLTFAINYFISGLNTFPMHLVSLLIHILNIYLVFRFLFLLFQNKNSPLIVSLLFAIHPMNVESVEWISARSSVIYTCFYLLALNSYVQYIKSNFRLKNLYFAGIFFTLSAFSKTQAVTLPVVLLLIDYFFERKLISRKILFEKIPFFIVSIIMGIVTLLNTETMSNITEGMMISYTAIEKIFLVIYSFVFYLFKLIFPVNLCSVHVYPPKPDGMLPAEYYFSPLILFAALYFLLRFRKNKIVVFGAALFLITISINIQLIPSRLFIVTERYGYFPYIGLFLIPAVLFHQLKSRNVFLYNKYFPWVVIVLIVYAIYFSALSYGRINFWKNDLELMTDIINKNPAVPYIYRAYGTRGNFHLAQNKLHEAVSDFTQAIQLYPTDSRNYLNRAFASIRMNNYKLALSDLDTAIYYEPEQPLLYATRAMVKVNLNELQGAVADCNKCLELDSTYADAYNTRAAVEFNLKDYTNCENDLNHAIRYNNKFAEAYKNRGQLHIALGKKGSACSDFQKAIDLGSNEAYSLWQSNCQ